MLLASEACVSKALRNLRVFQLEYNDGTAIQTELWRKCTKRHKRLPIYLPIVEEYKKNKIIMHVVKNQNWWVSWVTWKTSEPICILPSVSSEKKLIYFIPFYSALRNLAEVGHDYFFKQEANCPISRKFKFSCKQPAFPPLLWSLHKMAVTAPRQRTVNKLYSYFLYNPVT